MKSELNGRTYDGYAGYSVDECGDEGRKSSTIGDHVPVHRGHRRNVLLVDNKSNHESDTDNERHENLKVGPCVSHTGPGETDIAQYRTGD
jgi:hypothetical protein